MEEHFVRDNKWQREMRNSILAPNFYGKYAVDGRYVFADKGRLANALQRRCAVDTIVQGKGGAAICIEEKIVRWPIDKATGQPRDRAHTAFCLETKSCTVQGRESPGWMSYGQADYLLYCFSNKTEDNLDCWLVDFPALMAWFWPLAETFNWTRTNQLNKSECRLVDIRKAKAAVPCWNFQAGRSPAEPDRETWDSMWAKPYTGPDSSGGE